MTLTSLSSDLTPSQGPPPTGMNPHQRSYQPPFPFAHSASPDQTGFPFPVIRGSTRPPYPQFQPGIAPLTTESHANFRIKTRKFQRPAAQTSLESLHPYALPPGFAPPSLRKTLPPPSRVFPSHTLPRHTASSARLIRPARLPVTAVILPRPALHPARPPTNPVDTSADCSCTAVSQETA